MLPKAMETSFIALIPKVENPQALSEFKPITLVGSLYKILAKWLVNRLKAVVGKFVSKSQTDFKPGR